MMPKPPPSSLRSVVEDVVYEVDPAGEDDLVADLDAAILFLAERRDKLLGAGTERYLRARVTFAQNAILVAVREPRPVLGLVERFADSVAGMAMLAERRDTAAMLSRLTQALRGPEPSHVERRAALVEDLRTWAPLYQALADAESRDVGESDAAAFTSLVRVWWPEVARRLDRHADKVLAALRVRRGRRRNDASETRTADGVLDDLLRAIGLEGVAAVKRARPRRKR